MKSITAPLTSLLTGYPSKVSAQRKSERKVTSHPRITARELEVLHLIAHEHSSKDIAAKLYISIETTNSHRKNIMTKLGVKNTAGMIRVAFEKGLLLLH